MRRWTIPLLLMAGSLSAGAQTFNCGPSGTAWTNGSPSGTCGVQYNYNTGSRGTFNLAGTASGCSAGVSGGGVTLNCAGDQHSVLSLTYNTPVNVDAFSTSFSFVPNGFNFTLAINNCGTGAVGCGGGGSGYSFFGQYIFSSGAGCEAGIYQGFSSNPFPINVFGVVIDMYSGLTAGSGTLGSPSYSSVQYYQQNQSPCNPSLGGSQPYWGTNKHSTSPVPLLPGTSSNTCVQTVGGTCDTYSVQMAYDGSNLNLCMVDTTAANGTCSSSTSGTGTYFQQSWAGVCIPCLVDGDTAYIGVISGIPSVTPSFATAVYNWQYTVNSASANAANVAPTNGGGTPANAPTFSPVAGTYSGTQTVTISSTTGSSNICYMIAAAGQTVMPIPNNLGGCGVGTLYTVPVTISSSNTLYASAGTNGVNLPSEIVSGAYTIGAGSATAPSCSPGSGSSSSPIVVTCTNSNSGTTIMCYTENGTTPVTNGSGTGCSTGTSLSGSSNTISINSSITTLNVVAGTSTLSDSSTSSYGPYVITSVRTAITRVL
jgi:hypothetical protein